MPKSRPSFIYPYARLSEDIEFRVTSIRLDSEAPAFDPVVPQFRTADLSVVEPQGWRMLEVSVEADVPVDQLRELDEPLVCLAGECSGTNLRPSRILQAAGTGRWTGSLELDRRDLVGALELRVTLAARIDGKQRLVGDSALWTIHVDSPAIPVIEGTLPVRWTNFAESEFVPDSCRAEPFFADLTDATPVVYLNSGYEGLPELLSDDDRRPVAELALREAEYRRIATSVWIGMFTVSAAAVDRGDDDTDSDWPAADWQRRVLETLLPSIYETRGAAALSELAAELEADDLRDLQTRAGAAVAQLIGRQSSLKKRVAQLARGIVE
jgi:hypothetical protein